MVEALEKPQLHVLSSAQAQAGLSAPGSIPKPTATWPPSSAAFAHPTLDLQQMILGAYKPPAQARRPIKLLKVPSQAVGKR